MMADRSMFTICYRAYIMRVPATINLLSSFDPKRDSQGLLEYKDDGSAKHIGCSMIIIGVVKT